MKDETDPVDLLALTCLQVFEPFIYSNLPGFKEFLCGDDMSSSLSRGKAYVDELKRNVSKLFVKTRKVDLKYLEEFVNLDEAYNRIEKFVETDSFTHLTEDEKLNTILFLKTAKQQNKEDSFFGGVPEDALADWLEQIKH